MPAAHISMRALAWLRLFKHYAAAALARLARPNWSGIRFDLHKISLELTQDQYGRLGNGSTFFPSLLPPLSTNGFESTKVLYGTLR